MQKIKRVHRLEIIHQIIHQSILGISIFSFFLLVFLGAIGFFVFVKEAVATFSSEKLLTPETLLSLLDIVLWIFIVIELLNIAVAFIAEHRVILTVMEAVLVAAARKFIISGTEPIDFKKTAALALIIVSVGITWWLVNRSNEKSLSAEPYSKNALQEAFSAEQSSEERKPQ